jgi:hypothetical protein
MVEKMHSFKRFYFSASQKVVIMNCYLFPMLYYFLVASSPKEEFFEKIRRIQRWFLSRTSDPFNNKLCYRPIMALHRFQNPKELGGFKLVDVYAKFLALKIRYFQKMRATGSYFAQLIQSELRSCLKRPNDNSTLFTKTKKPSNKDPFVIYLHIVWKHLKISSDESIISASSVDYIFGQSPLYCQIEDTVMDLDHVSTKSLSMTLHLKLNEKTPISERQKLLINYLPNIDLSSIWLTLIKFKKYRSIIRVFLNKIWNAALFLSDKCKACGSNINELHVIHFFNCHTIKRALTTIFPNSVDHIAFLTDPSNILKNQPNYILALFSVYSKLMKIHFNNMVFNFQNFCLETKLMYNEEISRNYKAFNS